MLGKKYNMFKYIQVLYELEHTLNYLVLFSTRNILLDISPERTGVNTAHILINEFCCSLSR